jgi:hypothetical protein
MMQAEQKTEALAEDGAEGAALWPGLVAPGVSWAP